MIIISGHYSTLIKSEASYYTTCPICGQNGNTVFSVHGKCYHVMFVPFFPTGTQLSAHCTNCNTMLDYTQMPEDLKKEIYEFRKKQRSPLWHYTGLILVFLAISFIVFIMYKYDSQKADYMSTPKVNDIYEIYIDADKYYSALRIEEIKGDSVYFSKNKYSINRGYEVEKIDLSENYDTSKLLPIAIKDLNLKNVDGISLRSIKRASD